MRKEKKENLISEDFLKEIRKKIDDYKNYEQFLIKHYAIKESDGKISVLAYKEAELDEYFDACLARFIPKGTAKDFIVWSVQDSFCRDGKFIPREIFDYAKRQK